ncbi:MAG: hypothetical protein ACPL7I_05095 [Myxococcota bacterium]
MKRGSIIVCITLLIFSFASISFAGEFGKAIKKVEEQFDNMKYKDCLRTIKELEQFKSELTKDELIDIYSYKAMSYILTNEDDLAEEVIRDIYEIEPDYIPSERWAPKLREPFLKIRREFKGKKGTMLGKEGVNERDNSASESVTEIDAHIARGEGQRGDAGQTPAESKGFFKSNLLPLEGILVGGLSLATGIVLYVGANLQSQELRDKLDNSQKDPEGKVLNITQREADRIQKEIDDKNFWGNVATISGVSLISGGVLWLILRNGGEVNRESDNYSLILNKNGMMVIYSYNF